MELFYIWLMIIYNLKIKVGMINVIYTSKFSLKQKNELISVNFFF